MNLDVAYPNQVFTVVIWGDIRDQFEEFPEYFYRGKNITVSGIIIEYKGIAEIIVNDPDQINLVK
jgi:DNA/RNA endonuclease YhcR with UshA esterase domain